ncbi:unannotated protein [freshwater metagenome]|uniref:Unannotated protein n=1 Tax=freshwater metagenome TaxID=449393 RepID=A0A6J6D356_9ZZZZ
MAPDIIAATPTAPAGSTTILERSSSKTIALAISSSETVTTLSMFFLIRAKGIAPGLLTAIPSAMVLWICCSTGRPSFMD